MDKEELSVKIDKAESYKRLVDNKDFQVFLNDLEGFRNIAFEGWLRIPAENTEDIIKNQVLGKIPQTIKTLISSALEEGKLAELEAKESG